MAVWTKLSPCSTKCVSKPQSARPWVWYYESFIIFQVLPNQIDDCDHTFRILISRNKSDILHLHVVRAVYIESAQWAQWAQCAVNEAICLSAQWAQCAHRIHIIVYMPQYYSVLLTPHSTSLMIIINSNTTQYHLNTRNTLDITQYYSILVSQILLTHMLLFWSCIFYR